MIIERHNEGTIHETIVLSEVDGDMGEDTVLGLTQQSDGDVILSLTNKVTGQRMAVEFCTFDGGGRQPWIARMLRELLEMACLTEARGAK